MNKKNILLFAGTAETSELSNRITAMNYSLTISTISNDNLGIPHNPLITRKVGKMNHEEQSDYLRSNNFSTVICAVHPYAAVARENIITACNQLAIPVLVYIRECSESEENTTDIIHVKSHTEAAEELNKLSGNILLTTGSNNLQQYMDNIINSKERIYARVLNTPPSAQALNKAGVRPEQQIFGRGPFSEKDNIDLLKKYNIRTLVTKDGGIKGGTPEKISAAGKADCRVIIINRPEISYNHYTSIDQLIAELQMTSI